ncbi:AFR208Cp [Eremothecium gossypii ATCC 10895]|uniref:AFR208Cp n=1 Tax=Eremothecium gossypii (strain ATCC 10895 / CBS 109.51 / FGSC 9923 / NRRL Y-1056) TaxID=284811 RepID=Q753W4_EREGS|nr:AFR208Cp [Eremothecium gossypii ATCC 10895]AAS53579.1 AFR208Cp [Eremothecium gossypii ATCC 10895]AEY97892.1 FAFR208Cp [Eremothecium gossypii FDAG1]
MNDSPTHRSSRQHEFALNSDKLRQQQPAALQTPGLPTPKRPSPIQQASRAPRRDSEDVLQLEYNSVKQENDKLKNIITKLKQEIDVYSRLLQRQTGAPRPPPPHPCGIPLIESILVNSSKRRKRATTVVARAVPQTHSTSRVLKDASKDVMLGPASQALAPPAAEDLAPEDLLLMNRLTDLLKRMD